MLRPLHRRHWTFCGIECAACDVSGRLARTRTGSFALVRIAHEAGTVDAYECVSSQTPGADLISRIAGTRCASVLGSKPLANAAAKASAALTPKAA
jgi:hypothetical protein